ncbi:hypothetical protein FS749_005626 [Ceratobasidium sp. UAMH 11750]|nr:hypothetical protein FS749_005626 [Ceratobasidium sp. UAMH 11750]
MQYSDRKFVILSPVDLDKLAGLAWYVVYQGPIQGTFDHYFPSVDTIKVHIAGTQFSKTYSPEETRWVMANHISLATFLKNNGSKALENLLLKLFGTWEQVIIGPQLRAECDAAQPPLPWTCPIPNHKLGFGHSESSSLMIPTSPTASQVSSQAHSPPSSQGFSPASSQTFSSQPSRGATAIHKSPRGVAMSPSKVLSSTTTSPSKSTPFKSSQPKTAPIKTSASPPLMRSVSSKSASYQPPANLGALLATTIRGYQQTSISVVIKHCLEGLRAIGDVEPLTRMGEVEGIQLLFEHLCEQYKEIAPGGGVDDEEADVTSVVETV